MEPNINHTEKVQINGVPENTLPLDGDQLVSAIDTPEEALTPAFWDEKISLRELRNLRDKGQLESFLTNPNANAKRILT
ncbi:MAG TPA: hypothetical protein PLL64_09395, partial [Rhodothermales bacterium]|nr:hypothetical protein [Rhodothermales bacterium]